MQSTPVKIAHVLMAIPNLLLVKNSILALATKLRESNSYEQEMTSILFFGISIESMLQVRIDLEKRYEGGDTVHDMRASHRNFYI